MSANFLEKTGVSGLSLLSEIGKQKGDVLIEETAKCLDDRGGC